MPNDAEIASDTLPSGADKVRYEALLIVMAFAPYTIEQLADAFSLPCEMIEQVQNDSVAMRKVNDLKAYVPSVGDVEALLKNDAEANAQWLRGVRDGTIRDDPKSLTVRAKAAALLLDRQVAKKVAPVIDKTPAIEIPAEAVTRMAKLLTGTHDAK